MRERPNSPDAADLAMRATALWASSNGASTLGDAISLYERALALDARNLPAMTGLASALVWRVTGLASKDPEGDIVRADELSNAALVPAPDSSDAHFARALVFFAKRQWSPAIAQAETAIAEDRNNANAYAHVGLFKMFLGRSEDGFTNVETALRLSPRSRATL